MPRSTWSWPNHLCTSRATMMSSARRRCRRAGHGPPSIAIVSISGFRRRAHARAGSWPATSRSRGRRRRRRRRRRPPCCAPSDSGWARTARPMPSSSSRPMIVDQGRVLEQADEEPDVGRDDGSQGLGQDDVKVRLRRAEAERLGRLDLAARDGLEPAAHVLGDVGRREEGDAAHGPRHAVEPPLAGQEERQDDVGHEQDRDQRHAADELDVAGATGSAPPAAGSGARARAARRAGTTGGSRPSRAGSSAAGRPTAFVLTEGSGVPPKPARSRNDGRQREQPGDQRAARRGTEPRSADDERRPTRAPR